jgi:hypothetical protein
VVCAGVGSNLMLTAEEEAIRRGCRVATINYAGEGWEEFGHIQTAANGIRIFMRKTLIA